MNFTPNLYAESYGISGNGKGDLLKDTIEYSVNKTVCDILIVETSEGKSSLGGSSKYSMFVYFPKFSYIPLKLRFILALSNSPKIRSAMFTEDGNIGSNGNMFLGNIRGLQT